MSNWSDIKGLVNKDLGKSGFLSIDKLIMQSKEYIIPPASYSDAQWDARLIASWSSTSYPTEDIKFKAYANGYICVRLNFALTNGPVPSIQIYNGEHLVKNVSGELQNHDVSIRVLNGDTITIKFENASSYGNGGSIKVFGELVDHYGLREVPQ